MNEYQLFKDQLDRDGPLLWGNENHKAPVMLVGMGPDVHAKSPFSLGDDSQLRVINYLIGTAPGLCYYNYLMKAPKSRKNTAQLMQNILYREIHEFCRPRALVMFGQEVFSSITGMKSDISELRRTRLYSTRYPDLSLFVTYSMADVVKSDDTGSSLRPKVTNDLRAVYETDTDYFVQTRRF